MESTGTAWWRICARADGRTDGSLSLLGDDSQEPTYKWRSVPMIRNGNSPRIPSEIIINRNVANPPRWLATRDVVSGPYGNVSTPIYKSVEIFVNSFNQISFSFVEEELIRRRTRGLEE